MVPYVNYGQWFSPVAWCENVSGMLMSPIPFYWNVMKERTRGTESPAWVKDEQDQRREPSFRQENTLNTIKSSATATMALALILPCTLLMHTSSASNPVTYLDVNGHATVIDGTHLEIEGDVMRLWAMEAPQDTWCTKSLGTKGCAEKAAEYLKKLIGGQRVWCLQPTRGGIPITHGETPVVLCQTIVKGKPASQPTAVSRRSLSLGMVRGGWAAAYDWLDYAAPLAQEMAKAARKAKQRRTGMWRRVVVIPDTAQVRQTNRDFIAEAAMTIRGRASVSSEGQIEVGGQPVELAGIELAKNEWCEEDRRIRGCEKKAVRSLRLLMSTRQMACAPMNEVQAGEGPPMAFCTRANDTPCDRRECWINWQLVQKGHAIAPRSAVDNHPMITTLIRAEDGAIRSERGIWAGTASVWKMEDDRASKPFFAAGEPRTVTGPGNVIVSGRIQVGEQEVGLYGVQMPSTTWCRGRKNRNCEEEADTALKEMVEGQTLECSWMAIMWFGRGKPPQAICTATGVIDEPCNGMGCSINYAMVRRGLAFERVTSARTNKDRIAHVLMRAEAAAKKEKLGMWKGKVRLPKRFR